MSDNYAISRRTALRSLGALALTGTGAAAASSGEDRLYVVVADGDAGKRLRRKGYEVANELADGGVLLVRAPAGAENRLKSVGGVSGVSVDVGESVSPSDLTAASEETQGDAAPSTAAPEGGASETTDEPLYALQWDKRLTDVPTAHERTTGEGTTIAMLDTGIHADHPDLDVNTDDSALVRVDGVVDDDPIDFDGHGTHTAGIAAASIDDDAGIAGVAPDAELVSLRTYYRDDLDGDGTDEFVPLSLARRLVGLERAAALGADVACSTMVPFRQPEQYSPAARGSALAEASRRLVQHAVDSGTVVVQAAGNQRDPSHDLDLQHGGGFMIPGFVPAALTVGATGPNDQRAFYSYYGRSYLDVAAPGGGYETPSKTGAQSGVEYPLPTNYVLSTLSPDSRFADLPTVGEKYVYAIGTSMAAPQAAGAAALIRSIAPDVNPYRVMQAIEQSAEGGRGPEVGAGRLNVAKALESPVLNGARR